MDDGDLVAFRLHSVRTHILRSQPDTVVLQLEFGDDGIHLLLNLTDFRALAHQLHTDAQILTECASRKGRVYGGAEAGLSGEAS